MPNHSGFFVFNKSDYQFLGCQSLTHFTQHTSQLQRELQHFSVSCQLVQMFIFMLMKICSFWWQSL